MIFRLKTGPIFGSVKGAQRGPLVLYSKSLVRKGILQTVNGTTHLPNHLVTISPKIVQNMKTFCSFFN